MESQARGYGSGGCVIDLRRPYPVCIGEGILLELPIFLRPSFYPSFGSECDSHTILVASNRIQTHTPAPVSACVSAVSFCLQERMDAPRGGQCKQTSANGRFVPPTERQHAVSLHSFGTNTSDALVTVIIITVLRVASPAVVSSSGLTPSARH
jgi:hypothetical protein